MSGDNSPVDLGCGCAQAWPGLVVHLEDGTTEVVVAAESPGPLALLYQARCADCDGIYEARDSRSYGQPPT